MSDSEKVTDFVNVGSEPNRLSKLKTAFMYVLIGALVASALTSVISLVLGDSFSAAIGRSLLTILILFSHSLIVLVLLLADKRNQVGRAIIPTTILATTLANMVTTVLGTWDVISSETAWRCFGLYFLFLGAAYIIAGTLKLRINHGVTTASIFVSIGLIAITVLGLVPWALDLFAPLSQEYFRFIAALSILTATAYLVAIILRSIALGNNSQLLATRSAAGKTPGGMLAVIITIGTITAIVWMFGSIVLIVDGVRSTNSSQRNVEPYSTRN